MKRWSISTKDNAGRPAEKPVEESGEAPPLEKPSTSGMERAWHVLKKDIHQPFSKCRKYRDEFIQYGFTCVIVNKVQHPQCVVCTEVFAHESLKPVKNDTALENQAPLSCC